MELLIWSLWYRVRFVGCLLVVSYNFFSISKMSLDFKNSKTKMCFRTFWATLIFKTPYPLPPLPYPTWLSVDMIVTNSDPPSCPSTPRNTPRQIFISIFFHLHLIVFYSLYLNQFISTSTYLKQIKSQNQMGRDTMLVSILVLFYLHTLTVTESVIVELMRSLLMKLAFSFQLKRPAKFLLLTENTGNFIWLKVSLSFNVF